MVLARLDCQLVSWFVVDQRVGNSVGGLVGRSVGRSVGWKSGVNRSFIWLVGGQSVVNRLLGWFCFGFCFVFR